MSSTVQNTTSAAWHTLHQICLQEQDHIMSLWQQHIQKMETLTLREDLQENTHHQHRLSGFLDRIIKQLAHPGDYQHLRLHILSDQHDTFTPDAAGRVMLGLRTILLQHVTQNIPLDQYPNCEHILDEILLRVSEYYHEKRYRELAKREQGHLRKHNTEIAQLLDVEKKRSTHFSTINHVAQIALSSLEPNEIFRRVVHEVQQSFGYQHVSLYVVELDAKHIVMHARAGVFEDNFPEGYRQEIGQGIVGSVVASNTPFLTNDAPNEPRRIIAFPEEKNTQAELCVPICRGDRVLGALDILSQDKSGFDQTDARSLRVLADQLAWVIHNARLYQETRELKEFSEQVLQTIPLPLLLLDSTLNVVFANSEYISYHNLDTNSVIANPLQKSRPDSYLVSKEGREVLTQVFKTGEPQHLTGIKLPTGTYLNRVVEILITRLETANDAPLALVVIEDITESLEKAYESSLLRQISQTMQGILDTHRLLYTILTCVTAGTGLGFNRAILFQVDADTNMLDGKMGVGPANQEEASRIWTELALRNPSVDDILAQYDLQESPELTKLSQAALQIQITLDDPEDILAKAVREQQTFTITEEDALTISPALWAALGSTHFVVTPLVARNQTIGVIVADNLYSGSAITEDSVDLLRAFAGHAALALENAKLYQELQDKIDQLQQTQKELLQSERLAVIGELSAQIAHEIRNPLATIGGFARSLLRTPDPERTKTAAQIIAKEVTRLEVLLTDILHYTRPRPLACKKVSLPQFVEDIQQMIGNGLEERQITSHTHAEENLPETYIDLDQFKQVLINLLKNAYQAMPDGGELTVFIRSKTGSIPTIEIEIRDTGEGMALEVQEKLFTPYFTTKTTGTGLGLAICKQIVERHGGHIFVQSNVGQGTSVFIHIPQVTASEGEST
ncbi:MAG: GAF domain-containing protein [Candidatus Latescibacteria bacterium]|nr:GAF domain-containing protein [Candidatus Latescibacterota bacterium]